MIPGLFVPLHFRSRERKDHRENFRSRGTFVPLNIRSLELSLLWNFRSSGANVPRTFVPTKLSYHENEYFKNFRSKCPKIRPINLTIAYAHSEVQLNSSFSRGASKLLVSLMSSMSSLFQGDGVPWFSPPIWYL